MRRMPLLFVLLTLLGCEQHHSTLVSRYDPIACYKAKSELSKALSVFRQTLPPGTQACKYADPADWNTCAAGGRGYGMHDLVLLKDQVELACRIPHTEL